MDGVGAIILCPTRELAVQTFEVLQLLIDGTYRFNYALLIGGKNFAKEGENVQHMNILVCTPGRLL